MRCAECDNELYVIRYCEDCHGKYCPECVLPCSICGNPVCLTCMIEQERPHHYAHYSCVEQQYDVGYSIF